MFKARDVAGETEAAAESLALGNALKRRRHPQNIENDVRRFAALEHVFEAAGPVLDEADIADIPSPHRFVLVVGMPRSGTSLVEQILASHSQVHGAGELRLLSDVMKEIGWKDNTVGGGPTRDNLRALRRFYVDGIASRGIEKAGRHRQDAA